MVAPSDSMPKSPESAHGIEVQTHTQSSNQTYIIDASLYKNLENQLELICKDSNTQMYVTPQEALLLEMYTFKESGAPQTDINSKNCNNYPLSSHTNGNVRKSKANITPITIPQERAFLKSATPKAETMAKTMKSKGTPVSDRERVQNFLAHRQNQSSAGKTCFSSKTPRSSVKKLANSVNSSNGNGKRRCNPLADILKSTSAVNTSASAAKRPRRLSERPTPAALKMSYLEPGEIGNKRAGADLSDEHYMPNQNWDTSDPSSIKVNLPQVAIAANNTLVVELTLSKETDFCINFYQKCEKLGASGKTLYQLSYRENEEEPFQQSWNVDRTKEFSFPLDKDLISFGKAFSLRISVTLEGYVLMVNQVFAGKCRHQVPIVEGEDLSISILSHDAHEDQQSIAVHRIWWGHTELLSSETNTLSSASSRSPGKQSLDRGDSNRTASGNRTSRHTPHPFELFVGNLPHGTSREELSFLFEYLGYETVRITQRGSGFVTLRSAEDMDRAVEHLNGKTFNGRILQVSCALPAKSASNYG